MCILGRSLFVGCLIEDRCASADECGFLYIYDSGLIVFWPVGNLDMTWDMQRLEILQSNSVCAEVIFLRPRSLYEDSYLLYMGIPKLKIMGAI